jgi:ribosomal-protein-alanine N-acetyltransferase
MTDPRPSVRLVEATTDHLTAYAAGRDSLAGAVGFPLPDGWPEFPEAFGYTLEVLTENPADHAWWMYFFIDERAEALVGSGGFKGRPVHRSVEIGYEIGPPWRGRGYATAAAAALVQTARASGSVDVVTAHTLGEENASVAVLLHNGFVRSGEVTDPDHGVIWSWSLDLRA